MPENIFSFLRLQVGDQIILGNKTADCINEIRVIHATIISINPGSIHVCQTINDPGAKKQFACWWGIGRVDDNAVLSTELHLGSDVRGDTIPAGQFLVFIMNNKPYVFSLTSIEVNPGGNSVAQDLTKL